MKNRATTIEIYSGEINLQRVHLSSKDKMVDIVSIFMSGFLVSIVDVLFIQFLKFKTLEGNLFFCYSNNSKLS